jgi:hypothetical protein
MKYVAVVIVTSLVALSGCGSSMTGSGEDQVRSVVLG